MLHGLISTIEIIGLALCVVGATIGAFQVAVFVGLVVLGVMLVAAMQVAEWLLTVPVDPPSGDVYEGVL